MAKGPVAIVTHNNPDPDSIGAAYGLKTLLNMAYGIKATIYYGGIIGRAENRAMVSHLKIPLVQIEDSDFRKHPTIAVVDAQPGAGNIQIPAGRIPDIVIDHHVPLRMATRKVPFHDVRGEFGSSSTIITEYLRAAYVKVSRSLATALFYGLKTDTYDLCREAGPHDMDAYRYLVDKIDRRALTQIEHPLHKRAYYAQIHQAVENATIYDDVLITILRNLEYPDITAEVADWFYSMHRISWVLVIGVNHDGRIFLSVRTREKKKHAGRLIRTVVGKHGLAGGHDQIAGGTVTPDDCTNPECISAEIALIKYRFLKALGKPGTEKYSTIINHSNNKSNGAGA